MTRRSDKNAILAKIERHKVWIPARTWPLSEEPVKQRFPDEDALVTELTRQLRPLPCDLLRVLAEASRGHIVLTYAGADYDPTGQLGVEQGWVFTRIPNAVYLGTNFLDLDNGTALHEVTHLLDHLLGSRGEGLRLSEGGGTTSRLREVGATIRWLYRSEDFVDTYSRVNPREYLAQAVRFYYKLPGFLRKRDPAIYRFLRDVFLAGMLMEEQ